MKFICIGELTPINANEVYAIPSVPVALESPGAIQTSILETGPFAAVVNGLINGCFLKSAANTTVKLKSYIIAP